MTLFSSLWSEANGTNTPLFGDLWAGVSDTGVEALEPLFANGELGGYWPADPAYAYEDSAGTTPASVDGVVGYRTDVALGKHAVQATTANKPYLRRTPTTNKPWYDANTATGALNVTFASALGSSCTIATVTPEGVVIAENQTVGTTYNLTPPYGYNGDVLIINRALTPAEKALVTRVMQRSVPQLGSELVTNGSFDTDTWWSKNTGASISGGVGVLTDVPGAQTAIYANNLLIVGIQYYAQVEVIGFTGVLFFLAPPGGGCGLVNGLNKKAFTATSTILGVGQYDWSRGNIDNVSVKAIL